MNGIISYCGLICQTCPIYLAGREPDKIKKEKMNAGIIRVCKEEYKIEYSPSDITDCDGCMSNTGIIFSACRNCKIRKCVMGKRLANCAYCEDYACNDLLELFKSDHNAKIRLDVIRNDLGKN